MKAEHRPAPAPIELTQLLKDAKTRSTLPSPPIRHELRVQAGLQLQEVADAVSELAGEPVSRSAVCRWEAGNRTPTGARRTAYCLVLNSLLREMAA